MPRCNVPGCNNGSTSNLRKVRLTGERAKSLFGVPKCPILLKKWEDALQMKNKTFNSKSKVCEMHFNTSDIIKFDDTILKDGTVNRIPRFNYKLCDRAVPTALNVNKNPCVVAKGDSNGKDIQTKRIPIKVYKNNTSLSTVIKMEPADDIKQEDTMYQEELMPDRDPLAQNTYTFVRLKRDIINHELIMPSGWAYIFQQLSVTFIYIHQFAIHMFCIIHKNMSVQIATFDRRVILPVDVQFCTTADIIKHLNGLAQLKCCEGTGIASSYSKYCSGFISPNEECERSRGYQRCRSCHEFRNATLIRQENLEEMTKSRLDDERRKMRALHRTNTRRAKKVHKEIM